jgi:single-strand DNA-binding protein
MYLNEVVILGNLGNDLSLRHTGADTPVCNMNIATNKYWFDKDGNRKNQTEWHKVAVFGKLAQRCVDRGEKGSQVYVRGELSTRKWVDESGVTRYTTEILAKEVRFSAPPKSHDDDTQFGFGSDEGDDVDG